MITKEVGNRIPTSFRNKLLLTYKTVAMTVVGGVVAANDREFSGTEAL
jgi:hypothetical protein